MESPLTKEELDSFGPLSEAFDKLSLTVLGTLAADEIFGDQIDADNEALFLAAILDETQPIQSELAARLSTVFDMHGLMEPDRYSYQLFKRKAGYSGRDKRFPKSPTRDPEDKTEADLLELGQYCLAICLKDYQMVRFDGQEHILTAERLSPVFELRPHGKKPADRPAVPSNRTQIKLGNGKATLKPRHYLSILVWAFWDGHPSKENNIEMNTSPLQEVIDKLKTTVLDQESIPTQDLIPEKGIVIYDTLEEAEKNEGPNITLPEDINWEKVQKSLLSARK